MIQFKIQKTVIQFSDDKFYFRFLEQIIKALNSTADQVPCENWILYPVVFIVNTDLFPRLIFFRESKLQIKFCVREERRQKTFYLILIFS